MRGHEINPHQNLTPEEDSWLETKPHAQQPDYFEQQMKQIVLMVLQEQIVSPPPGHTIDDIAGEIAAALRSNGYVQWTGIGGVNEKINAAT